MIEVDSKAFKSGNSIALRLPKELGVTEGEEFTIRKLGSRFELVPKGKKRRTPAELAAALRAIGPPPGPRVGRLKPIFPKRPGL